MPPIFWVLVVTAVGCIVGIVAINRHVKRKEAESQDAHDDESWFVG
jgi:hypothetical protein